MNTCTLLAAAKINLYLEIVGSRSDGFHELVMVMQSVDLCDRITITRHRMPTVQLTCTHPQVPTDHTNLALRAAKLLSERFPEAASQFGGLTLHIEKNIPVGAGLAGGSSNAAAALVGIDLLWNLGLTQAELMRLGAELGSDVPFSIKGGTAIATGRGEALDPIPGCDGLYVVLAKYNSLSVSTPWAYKTYRQQFSETYLDLANAVTLTERQQHIHSGPMVQAIAEKNCADVGQYLYNDLEKVVLPAHEPVAQLKATMACGGIGTLMSGSGPTVFTLTETLTAAEAVRDQVRSQIPTPDLSLWIAPISSTGIRHQL